MHTQPIITPTPVVAQARQPYRAPRLTVHDALERLTLQSSGSLNSGTDGIPTEPTGPGNGD